MSPVPNLPVHRFAVPRTEELPAGVARCGGWGAATVHYGSDRHCGRQANHPAHRVIAAAAPQPSAASAVDVGYLVVLLLGEGHGPDEIAAALGVPGVGGLRAAAGAFLDRVLGAPPVGRSAS